MERKKAPRQQVLQLDVVRSHERVRTEAVEDRFTGMETPSRSLTLRPSKFLGWVFFYNSSKFLRTMAFSSMLMGNKPIFVHAGTGEARYLGSVDEELADLVKKKS